MATTENPGPQGELTLVDYFYESSSGHVDKSRAVKLLPGEGDSVLLTEVSTYSNLYKGPGEESSGTWTIGRDVLISLVKTHGKRVT